MNRTTRIEDLGRFENAVIGSNHYIEEGIEIGFPYHEKCGPTISTCPTTVNLLTLNPHSFWDPCQEYQGGAMWPDYWAERFDDE